MNNNYTKNYTSTFSKNISNMIKKKELSDQDIKLIESIKNLLKTHFDYNNKTKYRTYQESINVTKLRDLLSKMKISKNNTELKDKFVEINELFNVYILRMKINKIKSELKEYMKTKKISNEEKQNILKIFTNAQKEIMSNSNNYKYFTNNKKLNIFKSINKKTRIRFPLNLNKPTSVTNVNRI